MAKKRNKVNFHELRYPKNDHHSKIVEQHEKAIQEARYQEQCKRFNPLDNIKYAYEVAIGVIGRWLSILSKWYTEEIETYNLAEAFLLETVISEYVFLTNNAEVWESEEYKEWFEKDRLTDSSPHHRPRGSHDWAWQALKADKDCYKGNREQAEAFISEVQERVAAADCDQIRMLRDAEFARFSASDIDFEYYRSTAIQSHCDYQSLMANPPWLLEGIEKALQEWDTRGRVSMWDALATVEIERRIKFKKRVKEREKELREEHAADPEYSDDNIRFSACLDALSEDIEIDLDVLWDDFE